MITANEARKLTDEILEPVSGSVEFKAIMAGFERYIRKAIADGLEKIEIIPLHPCAPWVHITSGWCTTISLGQGTVI